MIEEYKQGCNKVSLTFGVSSVEEIAAQLEGGSLCPFCFGEIRHTTHIECRNDHPSPCNYALFFDRGLSLIEYWVPTRTRRGYVSLSWEKERLTFCDTKGQGRDCGADRTHDLQTLLNQMSFMGQTEIKNLSYFTRNER